MKKAHKELKTVLITGCSRGIGFATVKLLVSKGYFVYAGVRTLKGARKLISLAEQTNHLKIIQIDLGKETSIEKATKMLNKEKRYIDIIINNAGKIIFGPVETVSQKQFYDQFQTNLFGPLSLTQKLLPMMRTQQKGHIIFLGSSSGIQSHGMYGAYAASKFALEAICHSLAVNLYQWNIKVSIVELSATSTLIAKRSLSIGNRLKKQDNPYMNYTKNMLDCLQNLLINGKTPKEIANSILHVIRFPKRQLRYFATQKSKKVFKSILKDPLASGWIKEARESNRYFA